jgi:hypothetical protein
MGIHAKNNSHADFKRRRKSMKHFSIAMLGIVLALGLLVIGCEHIDGTIDSVAVESPVVTGGAIAGGVKLSWNPVKEASGYTIWRKAGDAEVRLLGSYTQDTATGKYFYLDVVSDTNTLASASAYTYTVVASPIGSRAPSQASVTVTTGTIPARGTQIAAPTSAALALDADAETITVTVTPAANVEGINYYYSIYRDDSSIEDASGTIYYPQTTAIYNYWSSYYQTDGKYTVQVIASSGSSYFALSDPVVSPAQTYATLFSGSPSAYVSGIKFGTGETASTITGYVTYISLSSIAKPGVAYSVERATVSSAGVVGAYAAVTLSKSSDTDTALVAGDLTPDCLGNLPVSYVYDRTLPITDGAKYSYRVKAVKGTDTQYKTTSTVSVNAKNYIQGSISVATRGGVEPSAGATGNTTYSITPYAYKGLLQTGDKLVLYWLKGNEDSYRNGPYLETNKVEFTKAELEASTATSTGTAKTLTVPADTSTGAYLYVQAYLVFADGTTRNVSSNGSFRWDAYSPSTGIENVSSYDNYSSGSYTQVYYAKLNYGY